MSQRSDIDARYNQHLINGYSSDKAWDMAVSEVGGEFGHYKLVNGEVETTSTYDKAQADIKKYQDDYDTFLNPIGTDSTADWQDEVAFEKLYGRKPTTANDYALIGKAQPLTPPKSYSINTSGSTTYTSLGKTFATKEEADAYLNSKAPWLSGTSTTAPLVVQDTSTVSGGGYTDTKTNYITTETPESLAFKAKAATVKEQEEAFKEKARASGKKGTQVLSDPDVKRATAEREALELAERNAQKHTTTVDTAYYNADGVEVTEAEYTVSHTKNPSTGEIENVQVGNTMSVPTSTDDVDDDPVPIGNPITERDTFESDNSTQAEANQAFNDAADAQQEADELLESGDMEAYNVAQLKANTALSKAQELQSDADFEADDDVDTDMFLAESQFEDLDDEYASRPEPTVAELRGGGTSKGDWRVRLRLAPQSDYLYNAPDPGILAPLAETDGIIFPYVPRIDTVHQARYNNYDLPHSNYRGYFYAGSHQERVIVSATFTAQDTKEANYMLAALHFLRSCTKMFYGQDMQRGTPPPLVFLSGLGDHQFNEHPCAVEIVNINLPNDVDYIKAGDAEARGGDFMSPINSPRTSSASSFSGALSRLFGAGMTFGGTPAPTYTSENIFKAESNGTTMMPTKMDINFNLIPIQTRDQVSNEYSLKDYASGSLLKKGFW